MASPFSREEWAELSALLDHALDLPAGDRAAWLDALRAKDPGRAAAVGSLLAEHAASEDEDFLGGGLPPGALPPSLAGQTFGPYTLRSEIGFGGMGSVWLAERTDGRFSGQVAVKLLNASHLGRHGEARFRREGSILARLRHPHIAHLVDAGIAASGQPFLVLEHVQGQRIDAYCDEKTLGLEARVRLFLDVLGAVSHAHAHLIVHRDLKPSNVLVTDDGAVKLLDFGIAKLLEAETGDGEATALTRDGEALLTPEYAAPEQLTAHEVTTRTDVYALGVLLYVLLSGRHPSGSAVTQPALLMRAIVENEPIRLSDAAIEPTQGGDSGDDPAARRGTSPRRLRAALRGDLDNIVGRALKKAPAERYESVEAFAADLRRYLSQEPVHARPDSLRYRAVKFVRRNRSAVALGALAAVALVAGVAGTVTQARRATQQAARADQEAEGARRQRDFALRELARAEAVNELNTFLLTDAAPAGRSFTAGALLDRAERIVRKQHGSGDDSRLDLLIQIGEQHLNRADGARAARVLQDAYTLSRGSAQPATRSRAACALADATRMQSDLVGAERFLREGLEALPDDPQYAVHRVFCLLTASQLAIQKEATDESVARAEEAQRLLREANLRSVLLDLDVSSQLAETYRQAGRLKEAAAANERAYALMDGLGRADTDRAVTILNNWGLVQAALGNLLEAERLTRRAVQTSASDGVTEGASPTMLTNLARVLRELDRLDEAGRLVEQAERMARAEGEERSLRRALTVRASVYRLSGQLDRASAVLDQLEPILRREEVPTHVSFAILASERAAIAMGRGDARAAIEGANRAVALAEASGRSSEYLPTVLVRRADIALATDRAEDALADGRRALGLWQATAVADAPSSLQGQAYLVQARALQALGRGAESREAAALALRHLSPTVGDGHRFTRLARELAAPAG